MTAERAIQCATFLLILVGLCGLSAWAASTYLSEAHVVLEGAVIALSWGVVLLILYVTFKRLDWEWWK